MKIGQLRGMTSGLLSHCLSSTLLRAGGGGEIASGEELDGMTLLIFREVEALLVSPVPRERFLAIAPRIVPSIPAVMPTG